MRARSRLSDMGIDLICDQLALAVMASPCSLSKCSRCRANFSLWVDRAQARIRHGSARVSQAANPMHWLELDLSNACCTRTLVLGEGAAMSGLALEVALETDMEKLHHQHQGEPVSHRCLPEPHMESEMMSVEKKWR